MFPAGSEGGTSRPGEGLFQEEEGCCFQSRRPWGEGRPGGFCFRRKVGEETGRPLRILPAVLRPVAGRGSGKAWRLPRYGKVKRWLCSMTDLPGEEGYGIACILSALSPYGWRTGGPVLDDAVVVRDTAIAVPKCIFIIKTNYYKKWPSKGFFFYPAPVQKLNTFSRHSGRL